MSSLIHHPILQIKSFYKQPSRSSPSPDHRTTTTSTRRETLSSFLISTSLAALVGGARAAVAAEEQRWGTRSFLWEHFFEPGLSPEDAATRIKNTAEGLHELKHMVDTKSWRYLIFYIRLKAAYLRQDVKAALSTVPTGRRKDYIATANELMDNMDEFDTYVRTPKVFESYVYYQKTLKSIDNLVTLLA